MRRVAVDRPVTTADDVLSGRIPPESVAPDVAAAIAPAIMDFEEEPKPDEVARRLELLRRMGPAAGTAIARIIEAGGDVPRQALEALDVIDPKRTLRMDSLVAGTLDAYGDSLDAEWALLLAGDASIAPLVDVLEGRREGSERAASRVLDALGAARPEVLAALRKVSASSDRGDAEEAAKALFHLTGGQEADVAVLLAAMRSDADFRAEVVAARPGIADEALALVGADSQNTRTNAALLASAEGRRGAGVVKALVGGSRGAEPDDAYACVDALALLGPAAADALDPLLFRLTASKDSYAMKSRVAAAVVAIGDRDRSVPRLADAFRRNPGDGQHLAGAVAALGGPDAAAILLDPLVAQLSVAHEVGGGRTMRSGPRRTVHGMPWVADVLGSLGEGAAPAVPALVAALDEDWIAANALDALVKVGPRALPSLRTALGAGSPKTRGAAAVALLLLDPSAEDAVPVLGTALPGVGQPQVSDWLGRLDTRHVVAVPAVRTVLADERPWVRVEAARALRRITGDAGPLVAVIREAVRAEDGRWVACELIAEAGRDAAAVAPDLALVPATETGPPAHFVKAIVASGLPAAQAVPLLAWAVRAQYGDYSKQAANALAALGPEAAPAVPALVRALEANDGDTAAIVEALAAIGPAAAPALPEVRLLLRSRWPGERRAARAAIPRIEDGGTAPR